jgi:hypothetical protein
MSDYLLGQQSRRGRPELPVDNGFATRLPVHASYDDRFRLPIAGTLLPVGDSAAAIKAAVLPRDYQGKAPPLVRCVGPLCWSAIHATGTNNAYSCGRPCPNRSTPRTSFPSYSLQRTTSTYCQTNTVILSLDINVARTKRCTGMAMAGRVNG